MQEWNCRRQRRKLRQISYDSREKEIRKQREYAPAGHYGDAELEIGRVCVHLASPDTKYMSGETITLEGGMGQRP